jgi:hypothetical protein
MKLRRAKILWQKDKSRLEGMSAIKVMDIRDRETEQEHRAYTKSGGAAYGFWSKGGTINDLLFQFVLLTTDDGVDPKAVRREFEKIDEFRVWLGEKSLRAAKGTGLIIEEDE